MSSRPIIPGTNLNYGIKMVDPNPIDWYSGPYEGADEAEAIGKACDATNGIPEGARFPTMTVRLIIGGKGYLYWFKDGTTKDDLVLFSSGGLGETGPQGYTGPQGPTGIGLAGRDGFTTTIYPFGFAAGEPFDVNTTTVTHSFGDYPLVQVIDNNDNLLTPSDDYTLSFGQTPDYRQIVVIFNSLQSGHVVLGGGYTGAQGETGAQGFTGPQGNTGFQGNTGPQGSGPQGNTGPQGHTGIQGFTGPQGFTGNQGPTGNQGVTGPQGHTGVQGQTGPQGFTGNQGPTGNQGVTGPQGHTGVQGETGPQGLVGQRGTDASSTLNTPFTSKNQIVVTHSFGAYPLVQVIDGFGKLMTPFTDYTILHGSSMSYSLTFSGNRTGYAITGGGLSGPQGNTGPQGFTGVQGFTGPQGFTGNQGVTGPQGFTGVQGFTGPQGPTGNQGVTGPQGHTGVQGFTGPQGSTGFQGFTGPQGFTGNQGATGPGTIVPYTYTNATGFYYVAKTTGVSPTIPIYTRGQSGFEIGPTAAIPSTVGFRSVSLQFANNGFGGTTSTLTTYNIPDVSSVNTTDYLITSRGVGLIGGNLLGIFNVALNQVVHQYQAMISNFTFDGRVQFNLRPSQQSTNLTTGPNAVGGSNPLDGSLTFRLWKARTVWSNPFTSGVSEVRWVGTGTPSIAINIANGEQNDGGVSHQMIKSWDNPSNYQSGILFSTNTAISTVTPLPDSRVVHGVSSLYPLIKNTLNTQLFSKAIILDIIHHNAYGKRNTTQATSPNSENLGGGLDRNAARYNSGAGPYATQVQNTWNQSIGRYKTTPLWNDVDIFSPTYSSYDGFVRGWRPENFTYSATTGFWHPMIISATTGQIAWLSSPTYSSRPNLLDPEHLDNFIFNFDHSKMLSQADTSNVNTLLHHWMRLETGFQEYSGKTAFYGFTQTTVLFVNPGIGGVSTANRDYATVSRSVGVFTRQEVSNGYIDYAYDYFSSRVGNKTTNAKINHHIGYFAQSKASVSRSSQQLFLTATSSYASFTSSITGDPGSGNILWNNPTQSIATQINISSANTLGQSFTASLRLLKKDDELLLSSSSTDYQRFLISGNPTNVSTHYTVPVTPMTQSGAGFTNFPRTTSLVLSINTILTPQESSVYDPTGRTTYDFNDSPTQWIATYSYAMEPWSFYAESDKANLGGGLLINRGATFGTKLNAWLEIQGATASKAQIRLNPGTGPNVLGQGDMWFTGDNLYFYDGSTQYDLITSQNSGQKARLGVYPTNGTKLDDGVSWNNLGTVSVVLDPITNRDFTEETRATMTMSTSSSDYVQIGTWSFYLNTNPGTTLFTVTTSNTDPAAFVQKILTAANNTVWEAATVSNGYTIQFTSPYSTLSTRYGSSINGKYISYSAVFTGGFFSYPVIGSSFSGGTNVPDITYTIPSNNKSQDFVMTEGGQNIKGYKKFEDQQISFGPLTASATSSISNRMTFGTVSQKGDITHNIVGATSLWANYARYDATGVLTYSHGYVSSTSSQTYNIKQEVSWKNSLANIIYYDKGVPKLFSQRTNNTTPNKKHDRFLIDPSVYINISNRDNNYYKGSPIINISEWTSFVSAPNISLSDGSALANLNRGFTNSGPLGIVGGFMVGKGTSIQHHQWNDIGHLADIVNFQYTENGGFPSDNYYDNNFQLNNSNEDSTLGQGRVRSQNTVHHYLKTAVNMDPPVKKGSTVSRFNQDRHTNMFIESVGSGNPDYSFGIYHKSFGPHGKISADFFAAKPSNVFYNDNYSNINTLTSSQVGFYAQSKISVENVTDPLGRNYFTDIETNPWAEQTNSFYYQPWSFFAETDRAGFGGGALLMGLSSSVVLEPYRLQEVGTILSVTSNTNFSQIGVGRFENLNDIFFINSTTGWAVGNNGLIRNTTDGGVNWTTQTTPTTVDLHSVSFFNANVGWVVGGNKTTGYDGIILYTNDGGASWTSQLVPWATPPDPREPVYCLLQVWALSTTNCVVGGYGHTYQILRTTDGGANWSYITNIARNAVVGLYFQDSLKGHAVTARGTAFSYGQVSEYYKTSDGGATWTLIQSFSNLSYTEVYYGIYFVSDNIGFIAGYVYNYTAEIKKTTDGGTTWTTKYTGIAGTTFKSIYFSDANNGYVVGEDGQIIYTSDGGETWTPILFSTLPLPQSRFINFNSVYVRSSKFWIAGDLIPLSSEEILKSYPSGLPAWLTIQEATTDKSQIRFVTGSVAPTVTVDGDMWYTGTALNFVSEGTTYDLLTSGGGGVGNGAQGPTGPSGTNRIDDFGPTTSETITHNFGVYPVVQVLELDGTDEKVIIPISIVHTDQNQYTVTFANSTTGKILTGIGQNGNAGGQGPQGNTGPQGPTGPSELTPISGPTGSILVRYAGGWTAFSATTSTDVYLKSNGYNLPIWATVSGGGGGSGDVQTGQRWSVPIYSSVESGTTLDDIVNSTSLLIASQSGNTLTIPNVESSASFVMTEGTQTIGGTKSFTNPISISGDGRTQSQITVTGSNSRWIDFGNVGFGNPTASGVRTLGTKLNLKNDSTASVRIGVQDKVSTADSRLWLQTGLDGSIDFYRDNIRMTRFNRDSISFTGATISFGNPATSSLFGGYSVNLNVENETLTSDRTITLPVSDVDDDILVHYFNPGFTSSETSFSNLVVDAYGSISRGGEIETLGIYSIGADSVTSNLTSVGATAISKPTVIVPSGGKIIPAYWWTVGKVVTGKYVGIIESINNPTAGITITYDLKIGGSSLVTLSSVVPQSNITSPIEINFMITCRSLGSSGGFAAYMRIEEYNLTDTFVNGAGFATGSGVSKSFNSITSGTVNTNVEGEIDIFFSTTNDTPINSVNTRLTIHQAIIEYKN